MKITIVGCGNVGIEAASSILNNLNVDELILLDIIENLAIGNALDLQHAAEGLNKKTKIIGTKNYTFTQNSDYVVIVAGKARTPEIKDRLDLLKINQKIVLGVVDEILKYSNPVFVIVTNPVDVLTYLVIKHSHLDKKRVIGMGSILDTLRLRSFTKDKNDFVFGEHGESMIFIAKSNEFNEKVKVTGPELISLKGFSSFGPGTAIMLLVKSMIEDSNEIVPCSALLENEFGIKDICLGVPCKLCRTGLKCIVSDFKFSNEQLNELRASAERLKKALGEIK